MHNPKTLRGELDSVIDMVGKRRMPFDAKAYSDLEARRKTLQTELEARQAEAKKLATQIGKGGSDDEVARWRKEGEALKKVLDEANKEFKTVRDELEQIVAGLPNMFHESVPVGESENDNEEVDRVGDAPTFDFKVCDHVELGANLGMMDSEAAARVAGSRFTVLTGDLARLQRALTQWMLDVQTNEHGYTETYAPYLVNADSAFGTGQLPKFEEDLFKTTDGFYLTPTAEIPLTNLYRETIIDEPLPLKFVAHTPCFRREAGAYGKDTRGFLRQHQFEKVELVQIVEAGQSWDALEELTRHACVILERLELPYRKVVLCSGDLGFSSAKTYDLEVWLPGQDRYREISSCSNMTDFQARRMKLRYRNKNGKPELAHTLNGSGLAAGRALIAVMENYQDADGNIRVPEVLQAYMGGATLITPRS